jgi:hypothetical protein
MALLRPSRRGVMYSTYCSGFGALIHITDWVLASKVGHTHCRDEDDWENAVHVFLTGDQHC